ncbi:MAG: AMP-binding protein [Verrucomicrobiales bacterium]|nr:AMP-binding protein [Verrucomicrobiales bacterium]
MSRERITALQCGRLRTLLGLLGTDNAFYGPRLKEAGLDRDLPSLDVFTRRMPFTTKMDLVWDREEHPPYGSNLTFPIGRYSRYCQSSGTASAPLPTLDTPESWSAMLDCWDRVYDAAGVGSDDVLFFAFSFGPFLGFWTAFECALRRGSRSIPGGGLSSEARLQAMQLNAATVLCCTPTYALRLGEILSRQNPVDFADLALKKIIVAGEPGGSVPETRARLESLWPGTRVYDHHGMTEVGPISFEHPDHPMTLCIIEESYLAEVIDHESQQEVAEGETGELVITTLTRTATPLLRYRTGDVVRKVWRDAPPGATFGPVLCLDGGVIGRVDEMVVIRGVNIYPTAVEKVLRRFSEMAEYQVIQSTRDSMAELEVVVEPQAGGTIPASELSSRIARALHSAFALRIPVRSVDPGTLPKAEFKSRRWIKQ